MHTSTSTGFTFSPRNVLGFYYPNTVGRLLGIHHTTSFSTHSVLASLVSSTTASVVTLIATVTNVPLNQMSASGKLSYLMFVHSVLYTYFHHCVCGYLLCVVSCTECSRSTTVVYNYCNNVIKYVTPSNTEDSITTIPSNTEHSTMTTPSRTEDFTMTPPSSIEDSTVTTPSSRWQ